MAKHVYFAFHYRDVTDYRAKVVRKHNFTEDVTSAGYDDYPIWEEKRNEPASTEAVKGKGEKTATHLINASSPQA
jgi:hypothetical protein